MSNYTKVTNFTAKDSLPSGNAGKVVRGSEIDTEFTNIQTAVNSKSDTASPTFTGTVTIPTVAISGGTITGITDLAIADGGTGASTAQNARNNLLPSQSTHAGKYLKTDGTDVSWDALDISTADITGTLPIANGGTGATDASGARTALGLAIGTNVQAYDAQLADIAGLTPTDSNFIVGNGTNFVTESGATARTSLGLGSIATQDASNVAVTGGSINGTTIGGSTAAAGTFTSLTSNSTTTLNGTTIPASKTLVVTTDIGSTVQAYDADTAKYDDTTANFTGTLQKSGSNVLTASNIGTTVQGYDADTAKYDDVTANFTGTLQQGGSNVLKASDIGSTVQAYDVDTTKNDVTNTFTVPQIISANSSSDALRITQTGAGNALVVEDSANPDATPFVVDASGQVLVGATQAYTPITGRFAPIEVNAVATTSDAAAFTKWSNTTNSLDVNFSRSRGAIGVQTILNSGDTISNLYFRGSDGTAFLVAAGITAQVDGTPGTNDMPGRLVFSTTADGASSPTERMRIDNAGNVGIGKTSVSGIRVDVGGTYTVASNESYGVYVRGTAPSTATSNLYGYVSQQSTADAAFAPINVRHYAVFQGTITGGSRLTSTNQVGFFVDSGLTGATNNYGFYSNIPSGTGRWNFYANGTADNYFAGNVGLGVTPSARRLGVSGNLTGGTTAYGILTNPTVQSDVTDTAYYYRSSASTAATAFTLINLIHYAAIQSTIGATSAVTNQYGFFVQSNVTGATNNYGFYSDVPSGTGRWNFYANGTADNYFAGNTGIGTAPNADVSLHIAKNITGGVNAQAVRVSGTIQSDVTSLGRGYNTVLGTAAASFTLGNLQHFTANQGTFGAGSTVTDQYGFVANSSLTGATNNYGFYGNIASGSNRWNLYMNGTARNYLAGGLEVVAGTTSMTAGFTHVPSAAGVPTGVPTNPTGNVPLYYDTTNNKLYVYNGGWKSVTLS